MREEASRNQGQGSDDEVEDLADEEQIVVSHATQIVGDQGEEVRVDDEEGGDYDDGDLQQQNTQINISRLFSASPLPLSREDLMRIDVSEYVAAIQTSEISNDELWIEDNNTDSSFGSDEMQIVAELVTATPTLKELEINANVSENNQAVENLVTAVNNHPTLELLSLRHCGVGPSRYTMSTILPAITCSSSSLAALCVL